VGGFKNRPDGDGDYDDLSAPPTKGRPINELRPLAVKPRTPLAISREEVRPFLEAAAAPPSRAPTEKEVSSNSDPEALTEIESKSDFVPRETVGPKPNLQFNDDLEAIDRFTNLLDRVQAKDAFLGSELTQCLYLLRFDERSLHVAAIDAQWRTIGDTAEGLLQSVARTVFGDHYEVEIDMCSAQDERVQSETVFDRKQRLEKEHRAHRRSLARNDANIVQVQRALGAEIVDVQLMSVSNQPSQDRRT
jgi:hypothetical protein